MNKTLIQYPNKVCCCVHKISFLWLLMISFANTIAPIAAVAQTSLPTFKLIVSGEVTQPLSLNTANISAMKHTEIKAKDKDGKMHIFSGVLLADILQQASATLGKELRGENLTKCVLVQAMDGYQAVFSLPEIDPEFNNNPILLADKIDGQPLTTTAGPYRLIVPDEKKHTRWIRGVSAIQVVMATNHIEK